MSTFGEDLIQSLGEAPCEGRRRCHCSLADSSARGPEAGRADAGTDGRPDGLSVSGYENGSRERAASAARPRLFCASSRTTPTRSGVHYWRRHEVQGHVLLNALRSTRQRTHPVRHHQPQEPTVRGPVLGPSGSIHAPADTWVGDWWNSRDYRCGIRIQRPTARRPASGTGSGRARPVVVSEKAGALLEMPGARPRNRTWNLRGNEQRKSRHDAEKGTHRPSFEDYLAEQGTLEETTTNAVKRVLAWQLEQAMEEGR